MGEHVDWVNCHVLFDRDYCDEDGPGSYVEVHRNGTCVSVAMVLLQRHGLHVIHRKRGRGGWAVTDNTYLALGRFSLPLRQDT